MTLIESFRPKIFSMTRRPSIPAVRRAERPHARRGGAMDTPLFARYARGVIVRFPIGVHTGPSAGKKPAGDRGRGTASAGVSRRRGTGPPGSTAGTKEVIQ